MPMFVTSLRLVLLASNNENMIFNLIYFKLQKNTCCVKVGDKTDEDKDDCMSSSGFKCDFNSDFKTCKLVAFEGYSYNIYLVIVNIDIK